MKMTAMRCYRFECYRNFSLRSTWNLFECDSNAIVWKSHINAWMKLKLQCILLGCAECRVQSDEYQQQCSAFNASNMKGEKRTAQCIRFSIEWFNWIISLFGEIEKLHLYLPFTWTTHFTPILWTNSILLKLK